ncbi:hypothetical protein ACNF7N_09355 [Campylobacter coli]
MLIYDNSKTLIILAESKNLTLEANTKQGLKLPDKYTYLSFMQTYKKCKEVDEKTEYLLREYNT